VERPFAELMEIRYGAMGISCVTGEGIDQLVRAFELELQIVPPALEVS
jgi:hypothetical protein